MHRFLSLPLVMAIASWPGSLLALDCAALTGIDRRTAHRWRAEDATFDRDCRERLKGRRQTIR